MKVPTRPLPRRFYQASPDVVAARLLGKALVRRLGDQLVGGLIVETEAYLGAEDAASHSARGESKRNRSMFGQAGTLYVYSIHAKYCLNAVTEEIGVGSAVLIRAFEPVWAIELMQQSRGKTDLRSLARGPAMLCQALRVGRGEDGLDLCNANDVWVAETGLTIGDRISRGPRIGISQAAELPLRFFVDGNRYVSGRAKDHRQPVRDSLL